MENGTIIEIEVMGSVLIFPLRWALVDDPYEHDLKQNPASPFDLSGYSPLHLPIFSSMGFP